MKMNVIRSLSRRQFLSTAGSLSVTSQAVGAYRRDKTETPIDLPDDTVPYIEFLRHTNTEDIRDGAVPIREPVWNSVPHDVWVITEAAHSASDKIRNIVDDKCPSEMINVSVSSFSENQKEKRVEVRRTTVHNTDGSIESPNTSMAEIEKVLPGKVSGTAIREGYEEEVENIPVIVRETMVQPVMSSCPGEVYRDDQGDTIPGGTRIGDDGSTGTTAIAATRDNDGQNVIISAGHVLDVSSGHMHQPADTVGGEDLDVVTYTSDISNEDHGYAVPYDSQTFVRELASDSGGYKSTTVKGILTWDSIKYHEGDSNYVIKQQGNKTGTTEGYITSANEKPDGVKTMETDCEVGGGDSGGPFYHRVENPNLEDETFIAGCVSAATENDDDECPATKCIGTVMEYTEEAYKLTV